MAVGIHTKHAINKPLRDYFYAELTGLSPFLYVIRKSDGKYYNGASFVAGETTVGSVSELISGLYYFDDSDFGTITGSEDVYLYHWSGNGFVESHVYDIGLESFIPDATGTATTGTTVIGRLQDIQNNIGTFGPTGTSTLFGRIEQAVLEAATDSASSSGTSSARYPSRAAYNTWHQNNTPQHFIFVTDTDGGPTQQADDTYIEVGVTQIDIRGAMSRDSGGQRLFWNTGTGTFENAISYIDYKTVTDVSDASVTGLPGLYEFDTSGMATFFSDVENIIPTGERERDLMITTFVSGLTDTTDYVAVENTFYKYHTFMSGVVADAEATLSTQISGISGGGGPTNKELRVPLVYWDNPDEFKDYVFIADASGLPTTGLSLTATVKRLSDGQYLQSLNGGFSFSHATVSYVEQTSVLLSGVYLLDVVPTGLVANEDYIVQARVGSGTSIEYLQATHYRYRPQFEHIVTGVLVDESGYEFKSNVNHRIWYSGQNIFETILIKDASGVAFTFGDITAKADLIDLGTTTVVDTFDYTEIGGSTASGVFVAEVTGLQDKNNYLISSYASGSTVDLGVVQVSELYYEENFLSGISTHVSGTSSRELPTDVNIYVWNKNRPITNVVRLTDVSGLPMTGISITASLFDLDTGSEILSETYNESSSSTYPGIYTVKITGTNSLEEPKDYVLTANYTTIDSQRYDDPIVLNVATAHYRYETDLVSGTHFLISGLPVSGADGVITHHPESVLGQIQDIRNYNSGLSLYSEDSDVDYRLWNQLRPIQDIVKVLDNSGVGITGISVTGKVFRLEDGSYLDAAVPTFSPTTVFNSYSEMDADNMPGMYVLDLTTSTGVMVDVSGSVVGRDYLIYAEAVIENPAPASGSRSVLFKATHYRFEPHWELLNHDRVSGTVVPTVTGILANIGDLTTDYGNTMSGLTVIKGIEQVLSGIGTRPVEGGVTGTLFSEHADMDAKLGETTDILPAQNTIFSHINTLEVVVGSGADTLDGGDDSMFAYVNHIDSGIGTKFDVLPTQDTLFAHANTAEALLGSGADVLPTNNTVFGHLNTAEALMGSGTDVAPTNDTVFGHLNLGITNQAAITSGISGVETDVGTLQEYVTGIAIPLLEYNSGTIAFVSDIVTGTQALVTGCISIIGTPTNGSISELLEFISGTAFDDFAVRRDFFYSPGGLVTGVEVFVVTGSQNPDFGTPDFQHFYSYEYTANQLDREERKRA